MKERKEKNTLTTMILVPLIVMVVIILTIVYLLATWKKRNAVEVEIEEDETKYEVENFDYTYIQPIKDLDGDGKPYVVFIGNNAMVSSESDMTIPEYVKEQTGFKVDYLLAYSATFSECVQPQYDRELWTAYSCVNLTQAILSKDFSKQERFIDSDAYVRLKDADYFIDTLESLDLNEVDILVLCYSLTDFYCSVPSGEFRNQDFPRRTFNGALRYVIPSLQEAYPDLRIMVCTPYPSYCYIDGVFTLATTMVPLPDDPKNNGARMATDIIEYSIENPKFSVIDNFFYEIHEDNITEYVDGFVLNDKGLRLLGDHIIEFLE